MNTAIIDYVRHTNTMTWLPLVESGIDTAGIFVKSLNEERDSGRPISFLLKFEAGASYPYHNHPKGEEIFVLEGSCRVADQELSSGDYLYTPAGFKHAVTSESGCVLFLMVPAEVEIIKG